MKKYNSINQFRNVIRSVKLSHDYKGKDENDDAIYIHTENYPILKFRGTVKLHGSNASVVKYSDGRIEFQSRLNVLSIEEDNANFMSKMIKKDIDFLFNNFSFNNYCAVYGEWCGGNIQNGLAINGLEKMFVIFGIKVDDDWIEIPEDLYDNENNIYNILQFPTYEVDIDFNNPELSQNKITELTLAVEELCPVGKFFGKEGIGEGLVFTCLTNQSLKFKSKGLKHSVSKVKILAPIDTEVLNSINEFVEYSVTENRLEQGITYLNEKHLEIIPENIGEFLRWAVIDILKEESDTIENNSLDQKRVKNAIINKARMWFLNKI